MAKDMAAGMVGKIAPMKPLPPKKPQHRVFVTQSPV